MAAQIGAYLKFTLQALAGLMTFSTMPVNVVSATGKTVIRFGRAVGVEVANSDNVVEGLGTLFMGIGVRQTAKENNAVGVESSQYNIEDTVGILQAGNIWVDVGGNNVNDGDAVFFNDTTGVFLTGGTVGDTQIDNARFIGATENSLHQVLIEGVTQTTAGV